MKKPGKNEYIVTAWPEVAGGPGWSNAFINVLIFDRVKNEYRRDTIQQYEFSRDEQALFYVAIEASRSMTGAVKDRWAKIKYFRPEERGKNGT